MIFNDDDSIRSFLKKIFNSEKYARFQLAINRIQHFVSQIALTYKTPLRILKPYKSKFLSILFNSIDEPPVWRPYRPHEAVLVDWRRNHEEVRLSAKTDADRGVVRGVDFRGSGWVR